ncbi:MULTISPECIES: DUF948 domain-containing protein [Mammaliicoccus]|uniref:DUF948 domain-containing protein n=1 Tax=Mammaliicoccus fleurettii TaxID=150056 RepID=A0ABS5MMT9_9STAP|nr:MULTISPECIES: DUF948 domain-containing protein [Mammaliicoccus]HCN59935.1 DUF948 domain-containing protein [Staphylococcus sp.]MBL0847085.1 DUF948 domain-containing protein [Mammaliicoccus fleurettii]MBO3062235.1 DUF948 domain-containing protein [Mammaliicoccus fleurettii]MBS3671920.1 DUF948 domain-containing protein [Mammaliicoccus fleurettii]MBS3696947.1 DUF948 domain-containing protein [Mammaliicoccus fleurettii]
MDWILPIAGIIAAVAFLVICVVLALFLMQLLKTVKGINETLDGIQGQIQGITRESTDLLHKANRLTEDIQDKSLRLNSVVDAVKGVGDSVQTLNTSVDRVTNSITHNISQNEDKISQVIQWSNVAMEVADKWQLRRDRRSNVSSYKSDINSSNDFETQVPKNYNEKTTQGDNLDEDKIGAGLKK